VVTAINKSAPERLGGIRDGALEFSSFFNDATGQAHPALSSLPYTDRIATYLRGAGIGNAAAGLVGKQISYDPNRGADGSLVLGISVLANGYGIEWGQQLTSGIRTDTTATSPATGLDGAAASTFGLQAYLEVVALTGTSVTVTLQDSADNSSFANISGAAFSAASARGAQRIAVTGTVRRYVRAITSGTFSNAQFAVVLVRNEVAVVF
jgi:hypothetical protein